MVNNNGGQPLLDRIISRAHEGLGQGRSTGELIPDKLFGQDDSKMTSLPTLAAAVVVAAAPLLVLSFHIGIALHGMAAARSSSAQRPFFV
jgi:hypothetical protein